MIALCLGLLYALVNPPLSGEDEGEHVARLIALSGLVLTARLDAQGLCGNVDPALSTLVQSYEALTWEPTARLTLEALRHDLSQPGTPLNTAQVHCRRSALSPIPYLPALPVFWLGRLAHLPPLVEMYLARVVGLLCFVFLALRASVIAGRLGWAFFALAALPMSLSQAASVSHEAVTHGLALLFFALLARAAFASAELVSLRELSTMLAVFLLLVSCQPSFVCCALCFGAVRTGSRRAHSFAFAALALALGCAALAGWAAVNGALFDHDAASAPAEQWQFIAAHPLKAALTLLKNGLRELDSALIELTAFRFPLSTQLRFVGGVIAAVSVELLALLSWGLLRDPNVKPAPSSARLLVGSALALQALALLVLAYVNQSEPGARLVAISTRAFFVLMPGILLILATLGVPTLARYLTERPRSRIVAPMLVLHALSLTSLIARFFVSAEIDWPY